MVRTYTRTTSRASYSEDTLKTVIEKVKSGVLSKRQAFLQYGIPRSTLAKRMKNIEHTPTSLGRFKRVFDPTQEDEICHHAIEMQRRFYGLSLHDLRSLAYQLAERNGIDHPFSKEHKLAGKDWALAYIKRRSELSLRTPEATSLSRAVGFNRVQVNKFFSLLQDQMKKHAYSAQQVFNVDESGITTVQRPTKIIAETGTKQVGKLVSSEKGMTTTVVCAMSPSGNYVPPMILFRRKNMNDRLMRGAPDGSVGVPSPSGWMDSTIFVKYLNHFIRHVKPSPSNQCLLILDGHVSHKTLDAITLAKENFITMITIPPHTSHRLQPLDVAFFGPLKNRYNRELDKWMLGNPGKRVTEYDIAELFASAYEATASLEKAKSAFRKTGIFPYNADVFSDEDFLPSAVTEREQDKLDDNTDLQIEVVESTSIVSEIQAEQPGEKHATTNAVNQKHARKESRVEQPASVAKQVTAVNRKRAKKPTGLQKPRVTRVSGLQIEVVESTSVVSEIQAEQPGEKHATTTANAVNQKHARKESRVEQPASVAKQVTAVNRRQAKKPTGLQKPRITQETYIYRPPLPIHLRRAGPRLPTWHRANTRRHSTSTSVTTIVMDTPSKAFNKG